jgi:mono/diheme cytochrome c family protein
MKKTWIAVFVLVVSSALLMAADGGWLRTNPFAGRADAAAAGKILFADNCAKCHGEDAGGRHNRPSLRSERIANASDGELAWILRNGNSFKGMPSWSSLPEPERWQIVAYLRTLSHDSTPAATALHR